MVITNRATIQNDAGMFDWEPLYKLDQVWQDWWGVFIEMPMAMITQHIEDEMTDETD